MIEPAVPLRVAVVAGRRPDALAELVRRLPDQLGLAVVVPCDAPARVVAEVRPASMMPVIAPSGAIELAHDHVYVVPSSVDLRMQARELIVDCSTPQDNGIDRLLRSVAEEIRRESVAVLMSGHGQDGALGLKRIKEHGGLTIVQQPGADADSELPRAAIATGFVDLVLAPDEIAARLIEVGQPRPERPLTLFEDTLRDILTMIRIRSGHDFTAYKRATLYRRVARRMQVCQTESIVDYQRYLREHPGELGHLLRDFLISVTNFFRDPSAFEVLDRLVLPRLFTRAIGEPIRVWVAGCATGEEAYSLGMLLAEHAARRTDAPPIQIFATDIDEHALAEARAGRYLETIGLDVSPARLERFFVREGDHYRVSEELRDVMLFSPHNVLRDPPFSRLDLVSCRNLMIYLNRDAQERVLDVFHFALRPDGYMLLGASESADHAVAQFATIDAKARIYQRRTAPSTLATESLAASPRWVPPPSLPPAPPPGRPPTFGDLHLRLLEAYAPPSLLVDDDLDVVHVSERAGKFLTVGGGEPTRSVLRLVAEPLRFELRSALYAARRAPGGLEKRRIMIASGDGARTIELTVRAVDAPQGRAMLLVSFEELAASTDAAPAAEPSRVPDPSVEPVVRQLEDELARTREQLRTSVEQYATSIEELRASNEELHAINEELRSASEELETSKEELQAVNEELTTLNQELKLKVDEVSRANSDLQNLMSSTDIGVVFLDRALAIKRFTPRATELFNLIPADIGRPIARVTHRLDLQDLAALAAAVLQHLHPIEREVRSFDGQRYLMRVLPYRSLDDRIEGVVLTFIDVTDLRAATEGRERSEIARHASEQLLRFALRGSPIILLTLDRHLAPSWGLVDGHEIGPEADVDALFAPGQGEAFRALARQAASSDTAQRAELELQLASTRRTYDLRLEPTRTGVSVVGFDITAGKRAEAALREADRRKDEFLATLSHELRNPLTPLKVALDVMKAVPDDPVQLANSREIMERQVAHLSQLVDDLLDVSRVTQGKIQLQVMPLDAALVVEAALEATRPLLQQHRHDLKVQLSPQPLRVLGDQGRLVQVLTNLLSNAAKYTPDGGHIVVKVEPAGAQRVRFTVRDDGVGIPIDVLPHIFDLFVQSRNALGRAGGGLGIGLNVVRRLVELHGGSVSARSDGEVRGTELSVELPAAP